MTTHETIEFIKLVADMREYQKKSWAKILSFDEMFNKQKLESKVDAMLKNENVDVQKRLF